MSSTRNTWTSRRRSRLTWSDPNTFRGKVVYCNCDDPFESNFFKYFAANFNKLGLKKLITTSYDGSPIAGQDSLFSEYNEGNGVRKKPKAIALEIEEVTDVTGDGAAGIEDVKLFLEQNPHTRTRLAGGGDFRSPECVELLKHLARNSLMTVSPRANDSRQLQPPSRPHGGFRCR